MDRIRDLASLDETYVLLRRFKMPHDHGSTDAIAVTVEVGKILLSFYTLMMNVIILHLWYLFVLVAIAVSAKSKTLTRNMGVANVAIWNSQAPLSVLKAMFDYRSHIPLYAFGWALAASLAWGSAIVMSLLVSPYLIISNAAPANVAKIYYPTNPPGDPSSPQLTFASLLVPSNLRAIEVLEARDDKTGQKRNTSDFGVAVKDPRFWKDKYDNPNVQIDYSFHVSGVEFGLQLLHDLRLEVQGSCHTQYSWWDGTYKGNDGTPYDQYYLFNNRSTKPERISKNDGKAPIATVFQRGDTGGNTTFAFLISSIQRVSFSEGTDPWYLTEPYTDNGTTARYQVSSGRPPLVCWEKNAWSRGAGPKFPITEIEKIQGLKSGTVDLFKASLSLPRIIGLTQALGTSALKSASTSKGPFFHAGTSSIHSDLQRLVLGAYVATKNTLTELTLFPEGADSQIPNLAFDKATGRFKEGVADFVVLGSNFAALSIRVLIIIPVMTIFLWLTVYLLTDNPFVPLPWTYVNALKAPVLYTRVDHESLNPEDKGNWNLQSQLPHYTSEKSLAVARPEYNRASRTLSWDSSARS
jgi:hypothetical protein